MHRNELFRFVILAYVIAYIFEMGYFLHPHQNIWLIFTMLAPTLAVILSGVNARSTVWNSIKGLDFKLFPLALALGATPYIVAQLLLYSAKLGKPDAAKNLWHMIFFVLLGPFPNGIMALWEELGWRGYLQAELLKRFQPTTVYLIVGVIWAFWHLPVNLAGYNGIEHRMINSFLIFNTEVIAMAFVFGWLRSNSKTIWPCVILHGAINSVSNYWFIKPNTEILEKVSGLIVWVVLGFVFYFITKKGQALPSTNP